MSDFLKSKVSAQSLVDVLVERIEAAIVAALIRRDPIAAEQKMRQHVSNARQYVEELLTEEAAANVVAEPVLLKSKAVSLAGLGKQPARKLKTVAR